MGKLPAPVNGGGAVLKRKTPSELRGEQLKRGSAVTDKSSLPLSDTTNTDVVDNVDKRPGLLRSPKYTNKRVDEVFPARKSRFGVVSGKENAKENPSLEKTTTSNLKNVLVFSTSAAKRQQGSSCMENSATSGEVNKDGILQACQTTAECSQANFRSVSELSSAADKSSGLTAVDVGKALRGLAAPKPCARNGLAADSTERCGDMTSSFAANSISEYHVPGRKAPLDLTLKTSMRVVSSSSLNCFRVQRSLTYHIKPKFSFQQCTTTGQNVRGSQGFKVLHSWMYPQSILPPSLTSVLSSSTADAELDFLRKRQVAWEESFQDLYYMLRNNTCVIFYVCTSQFVVMFTGGDSSGSPKCFCNAYISRSTRGLRSLLRENDVYFSMPLCHSKVEQVATEYLVELSEIEKHNLGQTRGLRSYSEVDNSPQSLLIFSGNKSVHGLYDLLLNYRSFFTSLSSTDVPLLCSPAPFRNAAFSSPDVKCMEMRKAEHIATSYDHSTLENGEFAQGSSDSLCCSIEIKDTILPPWIICGACALLASEGRNFEASFVMEPSSVGLNIALESTSEKPESEAGSSESLQGHSNTFGIPEAIVAPCLKSCSVKGLKYFRDSYTASLSPV
ncbi:protein downstream neighbor of Son-like isoform X4 [Arachis ipaensis]|uniref:protein downstream neighbor of Son-like isoform X4 n=1 Tax=Arachis ipaensis TaxID=130454 RepID=UPI000A2B6493|nr:protein downstream neighbor of Son-like isoform X4 [Arachis ipaensis]